MLSDEGIVGLIKDGVIEGAVEENVGPVSYDLVTRSFYDRTGSHQSFDLAPGDSVFVACEEVINLPSDLSARVLLRNSRIRQGLSLDAPVYFPGHRTRVFFRVTNVSARSINLNRSKGIAQIVFDRVDGTVMHPYSGAFSDEFDFSGLASYEDVYKSEMRELDRKADEIKGMEKRIYERAITLFAIFAAIFTLVNVNAGIAGADSSSISVLAIDLSIVGGFSALVGLTGFVLGVESTAAKAAPLILSVVAFAAAYFV